MPTVLRWGRSAYERDEDLGRERAAARSLGYDWRLVEDRRGPPPGSADAEILVITSRVRVDRSVVDELGARLVITTTSGYDHVDVAACARRGIAVARCPEARRDAVVEHALGALLAWMRRLPQMHEAARAGRWVRGDLPDLAPRALSGARVAVIGLGVIGTRMADVLEVLGAEVLGVDPRTDVSRPVLPLDEALARADAVTLHCALTPSSRDLLDARALERLPSHAVVVNTARGEVLDVAAAVDRVRDGRLRGLACDVFPVEPYPELARAAVPGTWLTPHAAGFTHDLGARVAGEVARTLTAWHGSAPLPHPVSAG